MIKALIFDFDGLILDTETPDFISWQEIYQSHGCELSLEKWARCIGTNGVLFDPYDELETLLGRPVNRASISRKRHRRDSELIGNEVVRPGVETYLADAKKLGLKLGVASSSAKNWVVGHLSRLGLAAYFDCIKTGDDVEQAKPDPALYRLALDGLGLYPDEAIALEDSPNGILAAKRAGLFCVAVPNSVTRQLPLDKADLQLNSLAELPLANLILKVEQE